MLEKPPISSAVLEEWPRLEGEEKSEMWIGVYGAPSIPNLCLEEPHFWIRVDSTGDLMFGAPVGGRYGANSMTGSCIWRLKHQGGNHFSWFDATVVD